MADYFLGGSVGGASWTASDTVDFPRPIRGFQIATAANVAVMYDDGTTVTIPACSAGMVHSHRAKRILATGTGTTGAIVVFY